LAPAKASSVASIRGNGCASFCVTSLSLRYSTQNRELPSFFLASTTGED
ncbi:hypothetical protein T12_12189, partial [Trichinella patagoniensis]